MEHTVPTRAPVLPHGATEVAAAAAALGFRMPDACMPGVVANLAILAGHADILRAGARV